MNINYKYFENHNGYFIKIDNNFVRCEEIEELLNINYLECWKLMQSFNGYKYTVYEHLSFYKFVYQEDIEIAITTLKLLLS